MYILIYFFFSCIDRQRESDSDLWAGDSWLRPPQPSALRRGLKGEESSSQKRGRFGNRGRKERDCGEVREGLERAAAQTPTAKRSGRPGLEESGGEAGTERVYLPGLLAWPAVGGAAREALPSRRSQPDRVRARRPPGSGRPVCVELGVDVALDAVHLERVLLQVRREKKVR